MTKHYPTIKNTIWLLVFLLLISVLLTFIVMIIALVNGMELHQLKGLFNRYPQLLGLINLISIGLMVVWGFKKAKNPFTKVFPFRSFPVYILVPVSFIMIGLSILLSDLDNLLRWVLNAPVHRDDIFVALTSGNIWISLMVLVIVAPLTEEFLFRGVILTGFVNNYSIKKAIWVSALFFGIFHLNLFQFPVAFVSGAVFAWLVIKTRSLWSAMFGHALLNSIPLIASRVLNLRIVGYTIQDGLRLSFQPLWFDGIGLGLLAVGAVLLWPELKEKLEAPPELLREQPEVETGIATGVEMTGEILEASGVPEVINPPRPYNLGLVSLIAGITSILSILSMIPVSLYVSHHRSPALIMLTGFIGMIGILACLTGIGFGIAGLVKKI